MRRGTRDVAFAAVGLLVAALGFIVGFVVGGNNDSAGFGTAVKSISPITGRSQIPTLAPAATMPELIVSVEPVEDIGDSTYSQDQDPVYSSEESTTPVVSSEDPTTPVVKGPAQGAASPATPSPSQNSPNPDVTHAENESPE